MSVKTVLPAPNGAGGERRWFGIRPPEHLALPLGAGGSNLAWNISVIWGMLAKEKSWLPPCFRR